MHRKGILDLLKQGPIRVRMNNGDEYVIPSLEFAAIGDIAAHVLTRDAEDGLLHGRMLSLVAMCSVEPISSDAAR